MVSSVHVEPVSRTDQYKRVMKPMLERKRRARINRCLDELRDLLVAALQAEGETVTRLEKADILELTVRHVRRLNQRRALTLPPAGHDPRHDAIKFQQGFVAAAQQVQSFLISSPALEPSVSSRLITHLSSCASAMTGVSSPAPSQTSAPTSPAASPSAPPMGVPGPRPITAPAPSRHVMVPSSSPPMSPPPLMDLSMKPAPPKLVVPTPIREVNMPQDLSMRRPPSREQGEQPPEGRSSWRPW
ncbi:enhancer of split mbeta protein-like [Eriocheir sinensis]|uniref:enhancer of split mbeta protein-like n=1 Tax=Eriocheir sinensis TaxID=95602 RepID=UPI0021C935E4|nr:enhancer of split mbeta protein-like [Eriocheir sinensis]